MSVGFASCSTTNDVVSEHRIQKRKYRQGFFVQKSNKPKTGKVTEQILALHPIEAENIEQPNETDERRIRGKIREILRRDHQVAEDNANINQRNDFRSIEPKLTFDTKVDPGDDYVTKEPSKKGILGLVFSGISVTSLLGIVLIGNPTVLIMLAFLWAGFGIAGLIVSIKGWRETKYLELPGKAYPLVGMIIGFVCVGILVTAAVVLLFVYIILLLYLTA